ncbi:hypothetical protein JZ751_017770 [Albula glossodonta]|uniref:Uncharacterized protein n=1 Tax=Albula glossodonta TaxID=121402 RepID=A0A8T2PPB1_9TELE|nr:hypothetical protein JZ751_017770 [Albula glossodonta]
MAQIFPLSLCLLFYVQAVTGVPEGDVENAFDPVAPDPSQTAVPLHEDRDRQNTRRSSVRYALRGPACGVRLRIRPCGMSLATAVALLFCGPSSSRAFSSRDAAILLCLIKQMSLDVLVLEP